jgi:hypothetical protein
VDEQEPLEGTRDMAAVLQRPHAVRVETAGPVQRRSEPALTDRDRRVAAELAGARGHGGEGV